MNWQKLLKQEFKSVKALTYVPMKLDKGMMKLSDTYCPEVAKNLLFKTKIEDGKQIRS